MNMKRLMGIAAGMLLFSTMLFAGGRQEATAPTAAGEEGELPYAGVELHFAVAAEQFADYMKVLAQEFEKNTGAKIEVDILGYTELYQRITQDFTTDTKQYDLLTVDIMWSGEFAKNGWTEDLTPMIDRDKAEIDYDDIMPVTWTLGSWDGQQVAFPMAGYANSLIYRKDLFNDPEEKAAFKAKYGYELAPPTTIKQLGDAAEFFTRPDENLYGLVANGARGSAVAQDWMEYMRSFGASIFDGDGNVVVDSPASLASLKFFVDIFDKWAPPGAIGYWWDDRETSYRTGQAVMQSSWSIARAGYEDPEISLVVGKTDMTPAPRVEGGDVEYGFGGWGVGINADISDAKKAASWDFIKFITGKKAQKEWLLNDGAPIRRSTLTDPDLKKQMPWLDKIYTVFENGNGDYRPRDPNSNEIQSILALRINQAITHELTPEQALSEAAKEIKALE
ncbi:ABC transporter substrate-binding protein [Sediminispirochaeta smaragdinae]|uniref:Extracellular solute-binding protein family 1 n=1 Tax=Sediminispirochaeta smaragdinae (strain DSM 11293 / JCM 15392 / SEBR 4228) TaxID=573413 RepID=E1R5Y5_SEDSS|nr:sugar ABC transporter substrate-binding protein [Sediminispirochaeta smaragdinae]ADK80750.1 extracellular solute-binding protein family 1 [Sediminispirochaeta smaragdinae DSM 11293]